LIHFYKRSDADKIRKENGESEPEGEI